jgi:hypothetical protein
MFGGAVLGLTSAVRLAGPLAGVLVSLHVLSRARLRSPGPLLVYWSAGALVCYLAWPSLWSSPLTSLTDFLHRTVVEKFDVVVLFEGERYRATELPWRYLPKLLLLQTTIPALLLATAGFGLAIFRARDTTPSDDAVLLFLWFALPLGLAIALDSVTYDSGRHYLFARTPLFLFAGIAVERFWLRWKGLWIRSAFVGAVLIPGLVPILRLHPYEYIYFNELVGGVRGAFRQYELDYWATSYREAMGYVNRVAPPGGAITVEPARHLFTPMLAPTFASSVDPRGSMQHLA